MITQIKKRDYTDFWVSGLEICPQSTVDGPRSTKNRTQKNKNMVKGNDARIGKV